MYYLIYSSIACPDVDERELKRIITTAQRNNSTLGLTGMLIYHDGMFIQMLEGDEKTVEETFTKISNDPRHYAVSRVFSGNEEKRCFPDFSMALEAVDQNTFQKIEGYRGLVEGQQILKDHKGDHIGIKMLRYFHEVQST